MDIQFCLECGNRLNADLVCPNCGIAYGQNRKARMNTPRRDAVKKKKQKLPILSIIPGILV